MKDVSIIAGIKTVSFKTDYLNKLWAKTIEEVKNMNDTDSDMDNIFDCGKTMGKYWLLCDMLDIDWIEYAKDNNLNIIDF